MDVNRVLKNAAHDWVKPLLNILLDTVFPSKCLVCSRFFRPSRTGFGIDLGTNAWTEKINPLPGSYQLLTSYCCPYCLDALIPISPPICTCCGIMFKSQQDENHICGDCILQPKKFRMARAAMVYDHQLMAVIHRFKYMEKIQLARPLGALMLSAYLQYWNREKFDLILPVPLHSKKFRRRGFNQAYLLVHSWKAVNKAMHVVLSNNPLSTDILIRSKTTVPQTGLGRQQRLKNIKGAFSVRFPAKVYAKKILVVDDVYTTGATVNECARILLNAGAEVVDVLTLARTM